MFKTIKEDAANQATADLTPNPTKPTRRSFFRRNTTVGAANPTKAATQPPEPAPALRPGSLGDQCLRLREMFPSEFHLPAPTAAPYNTLRASYNHKQNEIHTFVTKTCKPLFLSTLAQFLKHGDVEADDLKQCCLLGLLCAFTTFDPSLAPYFEVHARFQMRNEVMKLVRNSRLIRGKQHWEFVDLAEVDQ